MSALTPSARRELHQLPPEVLWRWPIVGALLLTIPAFYAELLDAAPGVWCRVVYLLASLTVGAAAAHGRWWSGSGANSRARPAAHRVLDGLLAAGLLVAALGPSSLDSGPILALRLAMAFLALARMVLAVRHWVSRGGLIYLMGVAFVVLLLCGAGFWWLEPRTPTLADGLWLAFTTAATVGYGDVVPSTPASRIFAVFVVLLGYGVLTLVTAAIATTWIETQERRIEREILRDLHREVGALRGEIGALRDAVRSAAASAREPPPH
jgi:voltage-gated potassium channel